MNKFKRSSVNFSIKTGFQIRLLLNVMFIVLLGTAMTSAVFYFYASQEIGATFKQFHINARTFLDYLLPAVLASGVLGAIISFVIALFFPHHYVGPLYRIEKDLKEKIGEGDLTFRFKLRKRDAIKDLADNINIMTEKLRSKLENIEVISKELLKLISGHERIETNKVREVQDRLDEAIRKFKIH